MTNVVYAKSSILTRLLAGGKKGTFFGWATAVVAIVIRVGAALHWPNMFHPDEVFQSLEPAHRVVYGYGIVTWEWRLGVRSWVLPGVLSVIMRASGWMLTGSDGYMCGAAIVLALLSLPTVYVAFAWAKRLGGVEAARLAAIGCAIFWPLAYFSTKALTEVVATDLFIPGLYLISHKGLFNGKRRLFIAGVLCGFSGSLRIQLMPAILLAVVFYCRKTWRDNGIVLSLGILLPVALFGFTDVITWSYPWQSFIRYFAVNVIEGVSLRYGTSPWFWYLEVLASLFGPLLLFVIRSVPRAPALSAIIAILIFYHSVLQHKELRFVYPIFPLILILAASGIVLLAKDMRRARIYLSSEVVQYLGALYLLSASLIPFYLHPAWRTESGPEAAFRRLSKSSGDGLCGVAIYKINPFAPGGYTRLHRDVPILLISDPSVLQAEADTANALVASGRLPEMKFAYARQECWGNVCLYKRSGKCSEPKREYTMNQMLVDSGN